MNVGRYLRGEDRHVGTSRVDKSNQPAFSARQMREAMKHALQPAQATQAEVTMTDADAVQVYGVKDGVQTLIGSAPMPPHMKARELAREQFGHFEDGDGSDAELCFGALEQLIDHMERSAHRAILAQRPERVPMTDEQINEMALQEEFLLVCDGVEELTEIVRAAEAHHGITAQPKKEGA